MPPKIGAEMPSVQQPEAEETTAVPQVPKAVKPVLGSPKFDEKTNAVLPSKYLIETEAGPGGKVTRLLRTDH